MVFPAHLPSVHVLEGGEETVLTGGHHQTRGAGTKLERQGEASGATALEKDENTTTTLSTAETLLT